MNQNPDIKSAIDVLQAYWGYDSFRPGQKEAIGSVLEGNETMVLFPTGGGKSLCYQVPSLILDGLTLVISPLIALMHDQVEQLGKRDIRAAFINSTLPAYEIEQRLVNARNGMYRLLYVSPERLTTERWKNELPNLNVSLVAVDEAHCISEWGHDFRPAYRHIRSELSDLPDSVRWMALTATATPEVKSDILKCLEFTEPAIVSAGFSRPNLRWWVTQTDKKQDVFMNAVRKGVHKGSGIVYTDTRKDCEQKAARLSSAGISARAYHGGMKPDVRESVQNEWVSGRVPVVVATNAFGMGIDKSDCRFVVHFTIPFSPEAYYQEAGRAGRDGKEAFPILIWKEADETRLKSRILRSYPQYETLKKVYEGICDELGLATGSEHTQAEPVDLSSVCKRTALSKSEVKSSVEVLQRLEILEKIEFHKARTGVHFLVGKDYLETMIRKEEGAKAEFVDMLIRLFAPHAFGGFHYQDTPLVLEKLKINENSLMKGLHVLRDHDRILDIRQMGEQPLFRVTEPRMQKLQVDHDAVYHYRDVLLKKLEYMSGYAKTTRCREVYLRTYFGETNAKPCGHCDNCQSGNRNLGGKQNSVAVEDIKKVENLLKAGSLTPDVIQAETGWNRDKVKAVVSWLEREQRVKQSQDGTIILN
ncbi:RecQ family ATP-dependent DNA helicase [Rhodohalobacter mucosus]|uniref:ATP-dependent DNA helicase RecQ n=1 Tax=Rhodohalobacter mucosus TaxID=2079485 RepID=A0A316TQ89_9BACT|nr:ATP-dependent DNA helicase RecQ [Rhodohalobacter mucosus]PWN06560.1 RecQ family ATP-dependent DNA helicase [Rhodohalobacter mucosus]